MNQPLPDGSPAVSNITNSKSRQLCFGGTLESTSVSIQPNHDLLAILRAELRRIAEHRYEELTPKACKFKQLILHRIAIIEAAMKTSAVGQDTPPKRP